MQIHHGKKAGSRTTSDRSPYIEEARSRLQRLSLSPSDPLVPPSPDQLDLEYAQSQPVAAAPMMPPSPIKPKVVFQHRPLEVPTMGNLTQAVTVFEGVTPPKFIDVDAEELAGAYDAHRSKRGLANVKSTKSYWQELMTFLHSTGSVEDPKNPLTEENAADLMIQFMKNISRKSGMTSKHFMNLVSHVNTSIYKRHGFDMHHNDIIMLKARNKFTGLKKEILKAELARPQKEGQSIAYTETQWNTMLMSRVSKPVSERTTFDTLEIIDMCVSGWYGPRAITKKELTMQDIRIVDDARTANNDPKFTGLTCGKCIVKRNIQDKTNTTSVRRVQAVDNSQTLYCQCTISPDFCPVKELITYVEALSNPEIMCQNKFNDDMTCGYLGNAAHKTAANQLPTPFPNLAFYRKPMVSRRAHSRCLIQLCVYCAKAKKGMTAGQPFNFTHASMGYAAIQRIQPRIAEELKIEAPAGFKFTGHSARRTANTLAYMHGATERQREERFGYKPGSTAMRAYEQPGADDIRKQSLQSLSFGPNVKREAPDMRAAMRAYEQVTTRPSDNALSDSARPTDAPPSHHRAAVVIDVRGNTGPVTLQLGSQFAPVVLNDSD
jgi:hypothetical protein